LRKGVRFQNGEAFDAKAVKFSIERVLDPGRKSPQSRLYQSIDHVDIIDNQTVNIITKEIDVLLPNKLGLFVNIVPPINSNERDDMLFATHPIGTGPFKFFRREGDKEIVLIPNETYWGEIPKIDKVVFYFIPDSDKQIEMLIHGDLDIVSNISPRSSLRLKQNPSTDLVKKATLQYISSQLNTLKGGPLSDRRVRRAINHAIDVDKLIKYVFKGNGRPLATINMPEEFGFHPSLKHYPYDFQRAKEILKDAGYSRGMTLDFLVHKELEDLGKAITQQLSKVGIQTKTKLISRGDFIRGITSNTLDFDLTLGYPTDPYFDASFQLNLMFSSKSPFSRYRNEEVDQLLEKASRETNKEQRKLVLMKIQEIIHAEAAKLFLFQIIKLYGLQKQVSDFVPYSDGLLRFNHLSLRK
jgi:peptide/nickel transport system substrate-binding protein